MSRWKDRNVGLTCASLMALMTGLPVWAADSGSLEEITIVATRSPQENFRVPQMVTVIDTETIEDRLASSISEIFRGVPGVNFGGGPRRTGDVPAIRGQSGPGVLILFDGARQSFLSGHDGRFFVDPDLLAGVEVVKGPGSALYGSGALGGVMAFETLSADDLLTEDETWGARVKTAFQGVNDEALVGGTAFARNDRFDLIGNITYRNGGDIELGDGTTLQADDNITSSLLKGGVTLSESLRWTTSFIRFNNDATEPNTADFGNTADAQNPLVDKDVTNNTIQTRFDFNPGTNWVDLDLVGYYTNSEVDEQELEGPRFVSREVETFGFRLDNRSRFSFGDIGGVIFSYGGEFYRDDQAGFDSDTQDNSRGGVPNAETEFFGAYAQAEIDIATPAGRFLFVPGVRFDDFDNSLDGGESASDDSVSAKFSGTYEPFDWLMTFASYAEAFRAPTFNEVFADGVHFQIPLGPFVTAPNFFIPNPDLKPEVSETVEFGGGVNFGDLLLDGDSFRAKASYYNTDADNLIDLDVITTFSPGCFVPGAGPCTSGTSQNVNTAQAELEGFEMEAEYDSARFFARASFSSITGRDKQTDEFVGVLSPDTFYIDAGFRIPEIDLRLGSRAEIAGALNEVTDPSLRLESFEKVDIYAVWAPVEGLLRGLRVDLALDNVGDASFERVAPGARAPGRNFQAAIRYTRTF